MYTIRVLSVLHLAECAMFVSFTDQGIFCQLSHIISSFQNNRQHSLILKDNSTQECAASYAISLGLLLPQLMLCYRLMIWLLVLYLMFIFIFICIFIYIYLYIFIYIFIYICLYIFMYIFIFIYILIFIFADGTVISTFDMTRLLWKRHNLGSVLEYDL